MYDYVCVCMYVCMYEYMYEHMYVYICMYICMYMYIQLTLPFMFILFTYSELRCKIDFEEYISRGKKLPEYFSKSLIILIRTTQTVKVNIIWIIFSQTNRCLSLPGLFILLVSCEKKFRVSQPYTATSEPVSTFSKSKHWQL